jgi:Tfp pilus assembly protein PilN
VRPLNLASQPFRNTRLPVLLSALLMLLALGVSAVHALAISRILPTHLSKTEGTTRALEAELEHLQAERATLQTLRPSTGDLTRWERVRRLVDQRLLRWTTLLKRLDEALPDDVQITAIEPTVKDDALQIRIDATSSVRGSPSLLNLVRILEEQPAFEDVAPVRLSEAPNGDLLTLSLTYLPGAAATPPAQHGSDVPSQDEP